MLDERWSSDVQEIAEALQRVLREESSPERVRAAEARADGRDTALEAQLSAFGLDELEGSPELMARVAYELGRALAPSAVVETLPALALLGRPGVALAFDGLAPAALKSALVRNGDGVLLQAVEGPGERTAAGDWLVRLSVPAGGERIGDAALADRLARFAALTEAARLVGAGQGLLALGVAYANERQQFGKTIGSFQGVAHRLAQAAGNLDAADLLLRKAAFVAATENGGDGAPPEAFALMVRPKAVEAARVVATHVHQVFGGMGFAMECDVQLYSRRLRSWAMRGPRQGAELAALGRLVLDAARRDATPLMWHYDQGMALPRWAQEAEQRARRA